MDCSWILDSTQSHKLLTKLQWLLDTVISNDLLNFQIRLKKKMKNNENIQKKNMITW